MNNHRIFTGIVAEIKNTKSPNISNLLETLDVKVVSEVSTSKELIEQYRNHLPDILLLDIKLGDMDGMEAWKKMIDIGYNPNVIIITEIDRSEYLLTSFELGCIDYILKPVCITRLEKAIKKAMSIVRNKRSLSLNFPSKPFMISIINNHKKISINVSDLIYVEKFNLKISKVHLTSKSYETTTTLTSIIQQCNDILIKPHRSFIVNINYIESIQADLLIQGNYELTLTNGEKIPLTRRNYDLLTKKLNDFNS